MKILFNIGLLFFICTIGFAQQNTNYNQFMLNDAGLNPAAAGSLKGVNVLGGRRAQWRGFKYSPETNFALISLDIRKRKGVNYVWHGAGLYIEQDRIGIFTHFIAHGIYSIHLRVNGKLNMSFGVAGGIRQSAISITSLDSNDPIVASKAFEVVVPDFVPGIYFYTKKFTGGVSVKNVYKSNLQQGSKTIGTNSGSKFSPTAYIVLAKKIVSKHYGFVYIPAVQIQSNFISIPSAQLNLMAFYQKKFGLGVSYRTQDAIALTIQLRPWSHVVLGFSYDMTTSRLRHASGSNSQEFMFGYHHYISSDNYDRPSSGATSCPKFEL